MERIKSILSPGKHVEDEILYGSGGGQYEHTGRDVPGSTGGGYSGGTGGEPQIYDRERDSIPSQISTSQEYSKGGEGYAQAEKERAAKAKAAREPSTKEKDAVYRNGEKAHRKQRSGEHKESRNPYTQQAVDPRLGGATEGPKEGGNVQSPAGYSPTETAKAAQGQEREDVARSSTKGASAGAGAGGLATAAGAANAAGSGVPGVPGASGAGAPATSKKQSYATAIPLETDSPHGEVVGRTVSGHHVVERTGSGQYRTRLASIIDPNLGEGVTTSENAYEHTPGGGGAYMADKFHGRDSRVASISLPNGQKFTDPEAKEDYGLDYSSKLPSGVAYKPPAGSGVGEGAGQAGIPAYEHQGQPQPATTKSEAARAVTGEENPHRGAGVVGASVAGAAAAGAGYEATKDTVHPSEAEETTTTQKLARKARKSVSKAAPGQKTEEYPSKVAQPTAAKYGDIDVPPGNDYGKGVKDPRYGFPMAAAGISAEEAAALRRKEANVGRESDRDYAAPPTTANQAYAAQPTTQAEQQAAKQAKEEKPSRRSSILGFLHLGKDRDKKKQSKDEKRLSDTQRKPTYTDRTGQTHVGSGAGTQFPEAGSVTGGHAGHNEAAGLAYRDRQASTADAPAFTGGLVGPNGAPLTGPSGGNADSSAWAKSTQKEVMDKGGMGQGYSGGAGNQAGYGTGIDESYPSATAGTGAAQGQTSGPGVATTGGAIAAGAAAGLAANGTHGTQAHQGIAHDYSMESAQGRGAPAKDILYDQVSPRSSKAQAVSHETNGNHWKDPMSENRSHSLVKDSSANTAYAGSDAPTRDAAQPSYGGAGQPANANIPAYNTYGDTGANNTAAYGGKETLASNAAYGGTGTQPSIAGYGDKIYGGGGTENANEAAFGNEAYVSGEGNGVSRHGTTKVVERAGHSLLHKDPPASHPAAAMAGVE